MLGVVLHFLPVYFCLFVFWGGLAILLRIKPQIPDGRRWKSHRLCPLMARFGKDLNFHSGELTNGRRHYACCSRFLDCRSCSQIWFVAFCFREPESTLPEEHWQIGIRSHWKGVLPLGGGIVSARQSIVLHTVLLVGDLFKHFANLSCPHWPPSFLLDHVLLKGSKSWNCPQSGYSSMLCWAPVPKDRGPKIESVSTARTPHHTSPCVTP